MTIGTESRPGPLIGAEPSVFASLQRENLEGIYGGDDRESFEIIDSPDNETAARRRVADMMQQVFPKIESGGEMTAEEGILWGKGIIDGLRYCPNLSFEDFIKDVLRIVEFRKMAAEMESSGQKIRRNSPEYVKFRLTLEDQTVEAFKSQFPRIREVSLGYLGEYALARGFQEAGEALKMDGYQVEIKFPRGKDSSGKDVLDEEGRGIDWVITVTSDRDDDFLEVILVQAKTAPLVASSIPPLLFRSVENEDDLRGVLGSIKENMMSGYLTDERRQAAVSRLRGGINRSMGNLLRHARSGERSVLCLLPSLSTRNIGGVRSVGGRTDHEEYYDGSNLEPTPEMVELLTKRLRDMLIGA